jgi:hypothetical protein
MERTPHEGKMNRLSGLSACFQVLSVNLDDRTVECRTWSTPGSFAHDLHITKAIMVGVSNHYNGAESVHMPLPGAVGILHFVESQAYILGFTNPNDPNGVATNDNGFNLSRLQIASGDTVFYQRLKNYIAIRNSGVIEMEASPQLKTYMLPDRGELSTFCLNYDFHANGGDIAWLTTDKQKTTKLSAIIKDQVGATKIIKFDGGNVDPDNIMILQTGTPNSNQGIDLPNFYLEVKDTGETTLKVNDKATLNLKDSGATTFDTRMNIGITLDEALVISAKKDINVSSDTTINVKATADLLADAENIVMNAKTLGKAGKGASDFMVLGDTLLQALKSFIQTYNSHIHPYVDTPIGPAISQPPMLPAAPITDSVLSKKWKVE